MQHKCVVCSLGVCLFLTLASTVPAQVSFFQPPSYSGTGSLFVGDFNGDGKSDLFSSDGTLNLGKGDGSFSAGTPVAGAPLAVADFNGDGRLDVLEQTTGTLLVLLGNGDGTFQAAISSAPTNYTLTSVVAVDLNGDGKADVAGIFNNLLLVYLSNGDGSFASGVSYNIGATQTTQTALSVGDFNGDHLVDIAVTDSIGGHEVVFPGKGDGTFLAPVISAGTAATYSVTGDFNGDGNLDLALNTGYVLLGNGDGTFQAPNSAFQPCDFLAAADVNVDHKVDLVVQQNDLYDYYPPLTEALIYLGNGDGTFSPSSNYALGFQVLRSFSFGIAIADLNGDGKLDVASGNAVLLGGGDGTFQGIQVGSGGAPYRSIPVKFNKNSPWGVAGFVGGSISIFQNNGKGVLQSAHSYALQGGGGTNIVSADFNADGNADLLVTTLDTLSYDWSYSVLLGNGDGSFQSPVYYPMNNFNKGQDSIVAADFRHNGKFDVVIGGGGQTLALLLGNGDGTFTGPAYILGVQTEEFESTSLSTADFNGDGNLDIAVGLAGMAPPQFPSTQVLFGNGDGTFQPILTPPTLTDLYGEFSADFNNDGKPDLVGNNVTDSSIQVAVGGVNGTFSLLSAMAVQLVLGVADFNGDGYQDLFVQSNVEQTGILLGNGDGTFRPLINVPASGTFGWVLIADMNGDGSPDILFPSLTGFGVMLNSTAPGFEVFTGALSPATVTAGNQTTATVKLTPMFGFNGSVTLSCAGLPTGAACAFNPPVVSNASGTSTLTITTTATTFAGTYAVQVKGNAGSTVSSAGVSLVIQTAPSFEFAASGPTSKTVTAGQSASFALNVAPLASFSGTVNLSCTITPLVSPAPTCSLSDSAVQITGSSAQSVTITVGTTAPTTAGVVFFPTSLLGTGPVWTFGYSVVMLGALLLLMGCRKRPGAVLMLAFLALILLPGCGGSSASHQQSGTPSGNYNATVMGTSGAVTNTISFQVTVQ